MLLNKDGQIEIGPQLRDFKNFTGGFPSEVSAITMLSQEITDEGLQLRGEALSNSELIRDVHNSFARSSPFIDETQRTTNEDDDVYHFIAYTAINGALYELDGLQPAPISHGQCTFEDFPDKVIPVLQRRVERYPAHEIRFNLLAMVRDLRIRASEIGDQDRLYREEQKRNAWQWENALRRHNFVGFASEVLKGVARAKLQESKESYEKWVEDAMAKTQARREERSRKGEGGEELEA